MPVKEKSRSRTHKLNGHSQANGESINGNGRVSENGKPIVRVLGVLVEAHPKHLESAKDAGLRYVVDSVPGIRRVKKGRGFIYLDAESKAVRDAKTLTRIRSLVIPPAWTEVWICPLDEGHLQATGRDTKGRKQHRYHPRWQETRNATKFDRTIAFGRALPKIRKRIARDMRKRGLPREKVLATVVKLLETSLIRVGNEEYAKQNKSFGLTTMRDRHVDVNGSRLRFQFKGKSGVQHAIDLHDRRLAKIVQSCQDLPGQELFQYYDDDGELCPVDSSDVNKYLREIAGEEFTSKDFRTWAGTVLAARALQEFESFDSETQAKRQIVQAIESVAKRLGNTKTVCRQCYVHPAILEAYIDRTLLEMLRTKATNEMKRSLHRLEPEEAAVLAFLQQRLKLEVECRKKKRSATRRAK